MCAARLARRRRASLCGSVAPTDLTTPQRNSCSTRSEAPSGARTLECEIDTKRAARAHGRACGRRPLRAHELPGAVILRRQLPDAPREGERLVAVERRAQPLDGGSDICRARQRTRLSAFKDRRARSTVTADGSATEALVVVVRAGEAERELVFRSPGISSRPKQAKGPARWRESTRRARARACDTSN